MTAQSDYSETMATGFAGMLDAESNPEVTTMRNDESSAAIPFGVAVKYDDRANDPSSAALLTAITGEIVPGIVIHSHAYDSTQLDAVGVLPTHKLSILRKGRILVIAEEAVDAGDPLFVRAVAGVGELAGGLRMSADASDCIDMTGRGQWESVAAAGELAWLRVDFLNPLT